MSEAPAGRHNTVCVPWPTPRLAADVALLVVADAEPAGAGAPVAEPVAATVAELVAERLAPVPALDADAEPDAPAVPIPEVVVPPVIAGPVVVPVATPSIDAPRPELPGVAAPAPVPSLAAPPVVVPPAAAPLAPCEAWLDVPPADGTIDVLVSVVPDVTEAGWLVASRGVVD